MYCKLNVKIAVRELFSVGGKIFMLSNELSKWLKFHSRTCKAEFVDFGLDLGDLFRTLLRMKTQIIEQSQSQPGYLGRNNFITIFPPTKRQAASG